MPRAEPSSPEREERSGRDHGRCTWESREENPGRGEEGGQRERARAAAWTGEQRSGGKKSRQARIKGLGKRSKLADVMLCYRET